MELERVRDPRTHPFSGIAHLALAVGVPRTAEQRHVGVIYMDVEGVMLLHLAWHHDVRSEPAKDKYLWVEPRIPAVKAKILGRLCKLLADKYRGQSRSLAYALRYEDGRFDPVSGEFLTANGRGLTCATFVLAIFASRGTRLLCAEQWTPRPNDEEWQRVIVQALRDDGAEADHVAAVEQEIGCARFRPEEVAAAGALPTLPASFEHASRVGEAIVAWLARRGTP